MGTDPKALALLQKNQDAMLALRSYSAECWTTLTSERKKKDGSPTAPRHEYAALIAVKPNLMRYDGWELNQYQKKTKEIPNYTFVCDGKQSTRQYGTMYRSDKNTKPEYMHTKLEPWTGFYTKIDGLLPMIENVQKNGKVHNVSLSEPALVDTVRCEVVSYQFDTTYEGETVKHEGQLFIGPDFLVRKKIEKVIFGKSPGILWEATLRKIRTNFPTPARTTFAYSPPKGVKPEEAIRRDQKPLLTNGTPAPDFTTVSPDNKSVKLSDFRGKVVVLDFWATWCGPCISAMPNTNKIAREFKDKDVVVLGVNVSDEKQRCMDWIKEKQKTYESMIFVHAPEIGGGTNISDTLYNVSGIPTQFVIDRNGVIRASFVGFNPDDKPLRTAIETALKK
jgi:thiol-disulfide isomerase/thioredoxin